MYLSKRERAGVIPKREEKKPTAKKIICVNCSKPIAEGSVQEGFLKILCDCGTLNVIGALPKEKVETLY